jgi:hypothetical protein
MMRSISNRGDWRYHLIVHFLERLLISLQGKFHRKFRELPIFISLIRSQVAGTQRDAVEVSLADLSRTIEAALTSLQVCLLTGNTLMDVDEGLETCFKHLRVLQYQIPNLTSEGGEAHVKQEISNCTRRLEQSNAMVFRL